MGPPNWMFISRRTQITTAPCWQRTPSSSSLASGCGSEAFGPDRSLTLERHISPLATGQALSWMSLMVSCNDYLLNSIILYEFFPRQKRWLCVGQKILPVRAQTRHFLATHASHHISHVWSPDSHIALGQELPGQIAHSLPYREYSQLHATQSRHRRQ